MYCPKCRDEFRPGFTRCASCNVDLVESLTGAAPARAEALSAPVGAAACSPLAMVEYCGFVSLDEARRARDQLFAEKIAAEIAIRVASASPATGGPEEEYWLRVDRGRYKDVVRLLGFDEAHETVAEEEAEGSFSCGECGTEVSVHEAFCPSCGARFEED